MRSLKTKILLSIALLGIVFIISCNMKKKAIKTSILLASFKKATIDTSRAFTELKILQVYPAKVICSTSEKYANLYICIKRINGDTLYVFEQCEEVASFALTGNHNHNPVIEKQDVLVESPDKAVIFIPADFKMSTNIKYVFAKLSDFTEF